MGICILIEETNANNQMIIDNAAVQKLSHQEVETLKAESLKGNLSNDVRDNTLYDQCMIFITIWVIF